MIFVDQKTKSRQTVRTWNDCFGPVTVRQRGYCAQASDDHELFDDESRTRPGDYKHATNRHSKPSKKLNHSCARKTR